VIAIIGPTAGGKTDLALEVARKYDGEIICADSRTVYRGMDLGTAKPTPEEQRLVPHHLLDVVNPDQPFSVADFQRLAAEAMRDIQARGRLPLVVGGSGLYVDSLLYSFSLRPLASSSKQEAMARLSDDQLRALLDEQGISLNPSDRLNRRRLERAVGAGSSRPEPRVLPGSYHIIGLNPGLEVLERRIAKRTKQWFEKNILEETAALVTTFGAIEALNTPPYREIGDYLAGRRDLAGTQTLINLHLRQLAKRQLSWFRRNPDITWAASPDEAAVHIEGLIN